MPSIWGKNRGKMTLESKLRTRELMSSRVCYVYCMLYMSVYPIKGEWEWKADVRWALLPLIATSVRTCIMNKHRVRTLQVCVRAREEEDVLAGVCMHWSVVHSVCTCTTLLTVTVHQRKVFHSSELQPGKALPSHRCEELLILVMAVPVEPNQLHFWFQEENHKVYLSKHPMATPS